jgi:hypothetical protein
VPVYQIPSVCILIQLSLTIQAVFYRFAGG